jgi:hypothetical protein
MISRTCARIDCAVAAPSARCLFTAGRKRFDHDGALGWRTVGRPSVHDWLQGEGRIGTDVRYDERWHSAIGHAQGHDWPCRLRQEKDWRVAIGITTRSIVQCACSFFIGALIGAGICHRWVIGLSTAL